MLPIDQGPHRLETPVVLPIRVEATHLRQVFDVDELGSGSPVEPPYRVGIIAGPGPDPFGEVLYVFAVDQSSLGDLDPHGSREPHHRPFVVGEIRKTGIR